MSITDLKMAITITNLDKRGKEMHSDRANSTDCVHASSLRLERIAVNVAMELEIVMTIKVLVFFKFLFIFFYLNLQIMYRAFLGKLRQ